MMMPLDLSIDLSVHTTCHADQEEFEAVLAILAEEENLDTDQILRVLEQESKGKFPRHVIQDFVEARLGTFRRNMDFAQAQAGDLLDAVEEDELGDFLKEFVQARVHTFSRNMVTISSLFLSPWVLEEIADARISQWLIAWVCSISQVPFVQRSRFL